MDFWPDFWPIDFWPMRCLFLVFRKLRLETDYALKVRSMLVVWIATQSSHSMAPGHKTAVFLVAPQNSDCRPLEILCWYIRAPSLCGLRLYVIALIGSTHVMSRLSWAWCVSLGSEQILCGLWRQNWDWLDRAGRTHRSSIYITYLYLPYAPSSTRFSTYSTTTY